MYACKFHHFQTCTAWSLFSVSGRTKTQGACISMFLLHALCNVCNVQCEMNMEMCSRCKLLFSFSHGHKMEVTFLSYSEHFMWQNDYPVVDHSGLAWRSRSFVQSQKFSVLFSYCVLSDRAKYNEQLRRFVGFMITYCCRLATIVMVQKIVWCHILFYLIASWSWYLPKEKQVLFIAC